MPKFIITIYLKNGEKVRMEREGESLEKVQTKLTTREMDGSIEYLGDTSVVTTRDENVAAIEVALAPAAAGDGAVAPS